MRRLLPACVTLATGGLGALCGARGCHADVDVIADKGSFAQHLTFDAAGRAVDAWNPCLLPS